MSDPVRVLIVDDEPLARDTLRMLLEQRDDVTIVGECATGTEAVQAIEKERPDVVLLDIQMPGMTGFEVVETVGVEKMPIVIFATAYDEYALRAFKVHALDYLLKPFDDDRFDATMDRAVARAREQKDASLSDRLERLLAERAPTAPVATEGVQRAGRILVKDRDRIQFVAVDDIVWIEAAGDYVVLHTESKRHLIRGTMTQMSGRLDAERFVRIHRSTIINLDCVKELRPYFHGDYLVHMTTGKELRLSRRYWPKVEARFNAA